MNFNTPEINNLIKLKLANLTRYGSCGPKKFYQDSKEKVIIDNLSKNKIKQTEFLELSLNDYPLLIFDHDGLAANTEEKIVQGIFIAIEILLTIDRRENFNLADGLIKNLNRKYYDGGILGYSEAELTIKLLDKIRELDFAKNDLKIISYQDFTKNFFNLRTIIAKIFQDNLLIELMPGFVAFAKQAISFGFKFYWLTGNYENYLKGMEQIFNFHFASISKEILNEKNRICTGDLDPKLSKPNPELLNKIIYNSGYNKENCLYFGDRVSDLMTAVNSKINCVYIPEDCDLSPYYGEKSPYPREKLLSIVNEDDLSIFITPGFDKIKLSGT